MPERYYQNTIWTNHALERLNDRRLSQAMVWKAFQYPESSKSMRDGATEYIRRFGIHTVTVIAKQNDKKEWIIISCWMDPPLRGTSDDLRRRRYYRYKNGSFLTKLWMEFCRAVFNWDF